MPTDPNPPEVYPPLDDETCIFTDCDRPQAPGRVFCEEHGRQADRAARRLDEEERRQGWPSTQFESSDS